MEPLRNLLGVIHQRRCSDLFGSLVDALTGKVRPKVTLGLIVLEANLATPTKGYECDCPQNIGEIS